MLKGEVTKKGGKLWEVVGNYTTGSDDIPRSIKVKHYEGVNHVTIGIGPTNGRAKGSAKMSPELAEELADDLYEAAEEARECE